MLAMIVHAAIHVRETDDNISALMFLIVLFIWNLMFRFVSVLQVINLD